MNHYYTSDGDRVSKSVIDKRIRKAKAVLIENQTEEYGYNFCDECGVSSGVYLDCAHIVSVDESQKTRRSEMAWDVSNMRVLCRKHHLEHERQSRVK